MFLSVEFDSILLTYSKISYLPYCSINNDLSFKIDISKIKYHLNLSFKSTIPSIRVTIRNCPGPSSFGPFQSIAHQSIKYFIFSDDLARDSPSLLLLLLLLESPLTKPLCIRNPFLSIKQIYLTYRPVPFHSTVILSSRLLYHIQHLSLDHHSRSPELPRRFTLSTTLKDHRSPQASPICPKQDISIPKSNPRKLNEFRT